MSGRLVSVGLIAALLLVVVGVIYRSGRSAGAAKVEALVERQHGERVTEARIDERAAATSSAAIAATTGRQAAAIDDYVLSSIQEMRDALDRLPSAAAGDPLPAAPVDRLREQLNAGIARANRAGGAAAAVGRADQARDAAPAQR